MTGDQRADAVCGDVRRSTDLTCLLPAGHDGAHSHTADAVSPERHPTDHPEGTVERRQDDD